MQMKVSNLVQDQNVLWNTNEATNFLVNHAMIKYGRITKGKNLRLFYGIFLFPTLHIARANYILIPRRRALLFLAVDNNNVMKY